MKDANMMGIPHRMVNIPQFKYIIVGANNKFTWIIAPLTDVELTILNKQYKEVSNEDSDLHNQIFNLDISEHLVSSNNILYYGNSNARDTRLTRVLESSITFENVLVAPTPINLDTLQMGNKFLYGATVDQFYEYCIGCIGNPKNLIIFKA